ncbi:MAG: serine hydrolase domain-containing protein [Saprospiraceae bacterium]
MRFLSFCLVLFLIGNINAQTASTQKSTPLAVTTPENVGMSSERLARIDAMCEKAIANKEVPGMVALVARKGKIVYHKSFGTADHSSNRSYENDDIFRIASQTKAITSTAVMMLWEEGKFQLDDPISKYIPAFKNQEVLDSFNTADTSYTGTPVKKEITIRHLLTHTSGLGYGVIDGDERFKMLYKKAGVTDLYTTKPITIKESVLKLAKLPLHHEPGTKYVYSEGLDVLGYFIEVMSGMPFDEFLRTKIFDPLGMHDTWFYLPFQLHDRLVPVQYAKKGKWTNFPITFYNPDYPKKGAKTFFSGGAGLSSTAKDYATFLQMYLNKGELNGKRLLSRTTVDAILSNQVGDLWGDTNFYGLAFGITGKKGAAKGGEGSEGSFWWGGYFNTNYFPDPQEDIIGVIMKQTQQTGNDNTTWRFKLLVGQAIDD